MVDAARAEVWSALRGHAAGRSLAALEASIRGVGRRLPTGWPVGLEQDLSRPAKFGEIARNDPVFWGGLVASGRGELSDPKYARVPVELVLRRVWRFEFGGKRDPLGVIAELARHLAGVEAFRSARCSAANPEASLLVEYENHRVIRKRVDALCRRIVSQGALPPIYFAIGAMMEFLTIHPFPDGNGRVARGLFQLVLADKLDLPAPVFPLLPLMLYQRQQLYDAYIAWELRGDCTGVCSLVEKWLQLLVNYYDAILPLAGQADAPAPL